MLCELLSLFSHDFPQYESERANQRKREEVTAVENKGISIVLSLRNNTLSVLTTAATRQG